MCRAVLLLALAVGVVAVAPMAAAQPGGGVVSIGSGTASVGQTAYVNLLARDVLPPGTGTYSVLIQFDPGMMQMMNCAVDHHSVCETPDDRTIRIAAAATKSFTGKWVLAGITFRCMDNGVSPLTISISSWGSAIPETVTPQPELQNGTLTCVAATATATGLPTATPVAAALPTAGYRDHAQPRAPVWPAALLGFGVFALAAGALGVRRWRSR
jgi:hypothetical protein